MYRHISLRKYGHILQKNIYKKEDKVFYRENNALTLRRRQRRSMLYKPYVCNDPGEILRASSEGIVDITSNANQELAYFQAICFGLSTRR